MVAHNRWVLLFDLVKIKLLDFRPDPRLLIKRHAKVTAREFFIRKQLSNFFSQSLFEPKKQLLEPK